jgi:hypothetical protein
MLKQSRLVFHFILITFFLGLNMNTVSASESPQKTLALLPLKINAQKDLSYLKNGLRNMLSSRLAANTGYKIADASLVEKNLSTSGPLVQPDQLQELGKKIGADFVLTVDLTSIGTSYSLDAKVFKSDGSLPVETFYSSANNENELISSVDKLARDIAERSFKKRVPAPSMPTVAYPSTPNIPAAPSSSFQTAHPDRAFMQPGQYGTQTGGSPFIKPMGVSGHTGFTKTQNLSYSIQGLDVGDIDGDGTDDVVIASPNKITAYHLIGNRLQKFGEISTLVKNRLISVNIADLDKNGKAEIYATGVDWITPDSFAVEWGGNDFTYLFKGEKWYVKPMDIPGPGLILAGQHGGVDSPFTSGIYEMEIINGSLQSKEPLAVPDKINLYDFSMADMDGNGKVELINIDQRDRLKVLQTSGRQIWKADDRFGGGLRYVGGKSRYAQSQGADSSLEDIDGAEGISEDRIYIPSRIIVQDLNNDNLPDIIINKNLSTASRMLKNLKSYPSGELHGLSWNGIGLSELWRTKKLDGYVASYQLVKDKQDKNKAVLYVGLVMQTGWMDVFSAKESTVLIYQLDFSNQDQQRAN